MPTPTSVPEFLDLVRRSNQVNIAALDAWLEKNQEKLPREVKKLALLMKKEGVLTLFQAEQFLLGKHKGFHLGGYRLIERLGSGGMGTVYLAEHEAMKRRVALKILPPNIASEASTLERFQREAQAVAALDHPNIVRAYDFRQEAKLFVFAMEFIDGPSLQQLINQKGALDVVVACDYIRQAALGLHCAHEAGMVHRDIKPGNLLVDSNGIVKVLDLGLARFVPEGQESLTKKFDDGSVMGTADYIAPEQALSLHHVDHRADIYSLGATFYALLAGVPPFPAGTAAQKLLCHQLREPDPLPSLNGNVPSELGDIISTMMAKAPKDRFQSALEVADALESFCSEVCGIASGSRLQTGSQVDANSSALRDTTRLPASSQRVRDADFLVPMQQPKSAERAQMPPLKPKKTPTPAGKSPSRLIALLVLGAILPLVGVGVVLLVLFRPMRVRETIVAAKHPVTDDKINIAKPIVAQKTLVFPLTGHTAAVTGIEYSSNGRKLLSSSADKTVRVWDVATKTNDLTLTGHSDIVRTVNFNKAMTRIISASNDKTARVWSYPAGKQLRKWDFDKEVTAAIFGPTDEIITTTTDNTIQVWNLNDGKLIRTLKGHTNQVSGLILRGGPVNRRHLVSSSWDGSLRLWDLSKGETILTFKHDGQKITGMAVDPEGTLVVSAAERGTVRLWSLQDGRNRLELAGQHEQTRCVGISPDGQRVLLGGMPPTIVQWDLVLSKVESTYADHLQPTVGLAISPDGSQFASASQDSTIRVWKLASGN
jgi:serine/threonine protein kinase